MNANDLLQRIVDLLEADMVSRGVALPPGRGHAPEPEVARGGFDVEQSRKAHEAFMIRRRGDLSAPPDGSSEAFNSPDWETPAERRRTR
jgi:hypothetical protein